ncbi:hypothetical protein ACQ4M3_06095 [Leptolyngbya sp. AN03gr2]|uniref:hypothetical protein n=1 Tax=unclassified Leptolyngbya TaxID=2650499 RepID=UPI003D314A3C
MNRSSFNQLLRRSQFNRKLYKRSGVAALALMAFILPACNLSNQATAPNNATAQKVASNTDRWIGQTVTIRSEPLQKIAPNTFTMSSNQFFGQEPILVVNASGKPFVLPTTQGPDVQVTGQVRRFVLADIEREYKLGLDPNLYRDYESQPAIIAQSIALAPEPGDIGQNPKQYYNKTIAVTGEIEAVQNPQVFTLDEDKLFGTQDLLVLNARPLQNAANPNLAVKPGDTIAVTGVVRPFVVADLEREYDFNWDQGFVRTLEAEYRNRPVLVADGLYPSAIPE